MRSVWTFIECNDLHQIVFIKDIGGKYHRTVTNDAENVLSFFHQEYGKDWRVVYTDTDGEQWEIIAPVFRPGEDVGFERWHGLDWDILKR